MQIDIIKELYRLTRELNDMIAQEQDDTLNGLLCDLHDLTDYTCMEYEEKAHDELQSDDPPLAKGVPMGHNG